MLPDTRKTAPFSVERAMFVAIAMNESLSYRGRPHPTAFSINAARIWEQVANAIRLIPYSNLGPDGIVRTYIHLLRLAMRTHEKDDDDRGLLDLPMLTSIQEQ